MENDKVKIKKRQIAACGEVRTNPKHAIRNLRRTPDGWIEIMNEAIRLPACYINYCVLAQWHLIDEYLSVYIEKEKQLHTIVSLPFQINKTSRKKFENRGAFSFDI
jgi:hypothetical protein